MLCLLPEARLCRKSLAAYRMARCDVYRPEARSARTELSNRVQGNTLDRQPASLRPEGHVQEVDMTEIERQKLRLVRSKEQGSDIISELDEADPLNRQRRYVAEQQKKGGGLGLVFADAFIRGMREIGYKTPAWAIAELIDNSFQAGASIVDIRMDGVDLKNDRSKPNQIAIIDNGIGMIAEMIRHAVRWGGTDRENNRQGFGRYGYGLPSAAVSLARAYSVYSKVADDDWHVVHVDLEALSKASSDVDKIDSLLSPKRADPPMWLRLGGDLDLNALSSGTIVILEDLDRLATMSGWISGKTLQIKLLQQFGAIYRHSLPEIGRAHV